MSAHMAMVTSRATRPALSVSYEGGNPHLYERIAPFVDFLEVTPDSLAEFRGDKPTIKRELLDELAELSRSKKILVHGVGLSRAAT